MSKLDLQSIGLASSADLLESKDTTSMLLEHPVCISDSVRQKIVHATSGDCALSDFKSNLDIAFEKK